MPGNAAPGAKPAAAAVSEGSGGPWTGPAAGGLTGPGGAGTMAAPLDEGWGRREPSRLP